MPRICLKIRKSSLRCPRAAKPGQEPGEDRFSFRTLHPMRILPVELKSIRMERRGNDGSTMRMRFHSQFARNDSVGTLDLFVNHLGDFVSSLLVYSKLKQSLERASVCFNVDADEPETNACSVTFGRNPGAPKTARQLALSPVERARLAFHYPHQELFISVQVNQTPRNWTDFLKFVSTWVAVGCKTCVSPMKRFSLRLRRLSI